MSVETSPMMTAIVSTMAMTTPMNDASGGVNWSRLFLSDWNRHRRGSGRNDFGGPSLRRTFVFIFLLEIELRVQQFKVAPKASTESKIEKMMRKKILCKCHSSLIFHFLHKMCSSSAKCKIKNEIEKLCAAKRFKNTKISRYCGRSLRAVASTTMCR